MAGTEIAARKPNKFGEIFSSANRFLGPARGKNPFVEKANSKQTTEEHLSAQDAAPIKSSVEKS